MTSLHTCRIDQGNRIKRTKSKLKLQTSSLNHAMVLQYFNNHSPLTKKQKNYQSLIFLQIELSSMKSPE